ncbi:hypothetical protein RHMOL_Rhmol09G0183600 [Rhododendron molle]|uniref:Uncharacterized protein n=1 Tax=Rhododendron molle TaxID=49168 RepID=A0ACC0MGK4_RHOML|nr:hypothetical protein RHMOL_Rhmol09G0183600 [Rhododendron molle]
MLQREEGVNDWRRSSWPMLAMRTRFDFALKFPIGVHWSGFDIHLASEPHLQSNWMENITVHVGPQSRRCYVLIFEGGGGYSHPAQAMRGQIENFQKK